MSIMIWMYQLSDLTHPQKAHRNTADLQSILSGFVQDVSLGG
jgi:hypothetical protein